MKSTRKSRRHRNPHSQEKKQEPFFSKTRQHPTSKTDKAFFQAKLTIGQPNDKYEKEADSMADAVVNKTNQRPAIQQKEISTVQRTTLATPAEDEKLGTAEARMEKDKEIQEKPEIQRMKGKEEEEPAIQQKEGEEEETAQMKAEEEEPAIQQKEGEEEETVQMKAEEEPVIQQMEGEEEETAQMKAEEEEPAIQQMEGEEEETAQMKAEEEEPVQAKAHHHTPRTASDKVSQKIKSTQGKGNPLNDKTRAEMEQGFGYDFSGVNVHTGQDSVQMNKELGAQAFTHGQDVYFNAGKYSPDSKQGKLLLAHELTHVVQQQSAKLHPKLIQKQDDVETGMTVSQSRSDGPYGWTSSYGLEVTADAINISVDVTLIPDADVTAAQQRQVQRQTENEFVRYFDQRFNMVDESGQQRTLHVNLNFVDSGGHVSINLHAGAGHDDLSNWFVEGDSITRAHELGHQLGLLDEYVDSAAPNRATAASPGVHNDHSLMGNYYTEGIQNADVRDRHGSQLAEDISAATGNAYTSEWSNEYVVRRGDNLSWIAQRIYGDASKWRDIFNLNKHQITDPDLIYPGQRLNLPPR